MNKEETSKAIQLLLRWYCVDAMGRACLCIDEEDARHTAHTSDLMFPDTAPNTAAQMCDAAPLLARIAELERVLGCAESAMTTSVLTLAHASVQSCVYSAAHKSNSDALAMMRQALKDTK